LVKQGYTQRNVFRGKLEPSRATEVHDKHFIQSELDLILGESLPAEALKQGKPERYWVTMIAAYSGARLNEICQLDLTDIQKHDGIWVMDLQQNSADKSIKSKAGNRLVPLHPKLLDLGLLDYWEQVKKGKNPKLFPNLKKGFRTTYGDSVSKWFARYLMKLGVKKKGKTFIH